MRIEATLWTGAGIFYIVLGSVYWALSRDPAGTTLLLIAVGFGLLAGGWAWSWHRRGGERLEDVATADIADDAGVVGTFSAASAWPPIVALAVSITALGVIAGPWLWAPGIVLTAVGLARMVADRPPSHR